MEEQEAYLDRLIAYQRARLIERIALRVIVVWLMVLSFVVFRALL